MTIQSLIVVSMAAYAAQTIPSLSERTHEALKRVELVLVAVFAVEYLLRVFVAERKLAFMTSFFGVVDLLAVLPFYLATRLDLTWIRGLRLLRLVRVLKLVRYSRAAQRFHRALVIAREELVLFFFVTAVLLFFASVGIYKFEHSSQPDVFESVPASFWWAVTTLTTVGYGDAYPITAGGKIFTSFVLMIGLGVVAVPTGLFATALATARSEEADAQRNRPSTTTPNDN